MKTTLERVKLQGASFLLLLVTIFLAAIPLASQEIPPRSSLFGLTITGTVASSTTNTLVVRGEDSQFQLFVFDRYTVKPRTIAAGSTVRVTSIPGDEVGVRLAREITILSAPQAAPATAISESSQAVPAEIRRAESSIQRQFRKYQAGVRTGIALDPELILFGAHAQLGPFFHRDVFFRPNVEFGFGEVTALISINPEFVYRLPVTARYGRWTSYVGAGPGFNFLHQNFERRTGGDRDIDFGDFHSDTGFNILGGLQHRNGMFMELKTSVYTSPSPTVRLILGYNF